MPQIPYMIDQSHIDKPKIEAMIQTAVTAQELYVKAAAVDHEKLARHQERNELVDAEQPSRRPIFIATLRAGAGWLFFCVARSARMIQIGALRSRLEKQPTDSRQNRCYFGDRTLVRSS
jgi:hypothetical protein